MINFQDSLKNGRNLNFTDSSHEDQIALLVMNNIKRYQKGISASRSYDGYTVSSVCDMHGVNTAGSGGKTNLSHVGSFLILFQEVPSFAAFS